VEAKTSGRTSGLLICLPGAGASEVAAFTSSPETFTIPVFTDVTAPDANSGALPHSVAMVVAGFRLPEAQIGRFNEHASGNVSLHLRLMATLPPG
jgi:hypothetical protein